MKFLNFCIIDNKGEIWRVFSIQIFIRKMSLQEHQEAYSRIEACAQQLIFIHFFFSIFHSLFFFQSSTSMLTGFILLAAKKKIPVLIKKIFIKQCRLADEVNKGSALKLQPCLWPQFQAFVSRNKTTIHRDSFSQTTNLTMQASITRLIKAFHRPILIIMQKGSACAFHMKTSFMSFYINMSIIVLHFQAWVESVEMFGLELVKLLSLCSRISLIL